MNLLLLAILLPPLCAGAADPPAAKADATTVQLADVVIKTPTAELDPTLAGAFLKVDIASLPARQRRGARGKQLELKALIKVAEGKKKGSIRMTGDQGCELPIVTAEDIPMLRKMGFVEVRESSIASAETATQCSRIQMQCEFSLHIVEMPKGSKPPRRFFFQEKDPMLVFVGTADAPQSAGQTNFFGTALTCQKL